MKVYELCLYICSSHYTLSRNEVAEFFTGDYGIVHAKVKQTEEQPGPGNKDFAS